MESSPLLDPESLNVINGFQESRSEIGTIGAQTILALFGQQICPAAHALDRIAPPNDVGTVVHFVRRQDIHHHQT